MTQPRRALPAGVLVTAVQEASRATAVMAVVAVALVGTDAAVAVSRSAGSPHHRTAAAQPMITTNAQLVIAATPAAPAAAGKQPAKIDPQALLAKSYADGLAAGWVHAVARNTSKKIGTAIFDDYDARAGGIQHISIYGGSVTVRVVGPATYFTGDKRGLIRYMGFTADEVAALHHKWLRLIAGQTGYSAVTAGVTLRSTLHEDRIGAPLRLLPERTLNGVRVVGIRGHALGGGAPKRAFATMWVSSGDHPLPVEFVADSHGTHLTQTFSAWGKRFRLAAPANLFGNRTLSG